LQSDSLNGKGAIKSPLASFRFPDGDMNEARKQPTLVKAAILLFILIGLIYSNTLDSAWILDDYYNITNNPKVHISHLNIDSIRQALDAAPVKGNLSRPLSYLSFGLNWYWGKDDVTGYHVVNIGIHMLTAYFLFLTVLFLFKTPNMAGWDPRRVYFVALLSAVLWAVHPIQIQAVTYIVQRMTSMATLFYIVGILYYLKARLADANATRRLYFGLTGLFLLLGMGSKNNAILLPASLLLLEFIFFRDLTRKSDQKQAATVLLVAVSLVAVAGVLLFVDGHPSRLFAGYEGRPFSMVERVLTQPRVVMFYLSQIVYPVSDRFSIAHDFSYSTTLFSPWTTLPAIFGIVLIIGMALWRIKKNPTFAFAVLFFFGNHVIESSIIPLEMVFEHRNYLPSLFLFVPLSIGIRKTLDHYYTTQKTMFAFLTLSVCAIVMGLGTITYVRNWDWRSVKSLWEDAMQKAPLSARPPQNLAWGYFAPTGQIDKAIDLYLNALTLQSNHNGFKFFSYNNLAGIYYSRLHDYEKAVDYAQSALETGVVNDKINLLLCQSLIKLGRYGQAETILSRLLQQNPYNQGYLYLSGILLIKRNAYDPALQHFRTCLQADPENWNYLKAIGICLTLMEYYERGHWFLKQAQTTAPSETGILLALADNRSRAGLNDEAKRWIQQAIQNHGVDHVEKILATMSDDLLNIPPSSDLANLVAIQFMLQASDYSQSATRIKALYSSP
jgi:tetratricopeptide (TPR) repeat protein